MTTVMILWALFALAVGYLASQRGRSMLNWTLISLIASPILGFVLLMMNRDLALADVIDTVTHDLELTHVKCVHCAEYILPEAAVCPYCRGTVTPQPEVVQARLKEKLEEVEEIQASKQGNVIIGIGIVVGIALIGWLFTFFR